MIISPSIPSSLINKCNKISEETGNTQFIFESTFLNDLNLKKSSSKEEERELKISSLIDNSKFYIENENHFNDFYSMKSVYDTETRESNQYMRFNIIEEFILSIGFSKNELFYLGIGYENSYTLEIDKSRKIIVRISPNLFIKIVSGWDNYDAPIVYDIGFFSRSKILNYLSKYPDLKDTLRSIKLD